VGQQILIAAEEELISGNLSAQGSAKLILVKGILRSGKEICGINVIVAYEERTGCT
jgi:hypothetical protein